MRCLSVRTLTAVLLCGTITLTASAQDRGPITKPSPAAEKISKIREALEQKVTLDFNSQNFADAGVVIEDELAFVARGVVVAHSDIRASGERVELMSTILKWALVMLVVSLVAALFGLGAVLVVHNPEGILATRARQLEGMLTRRPRPTGISVPPATAVQTAPASDDIRFNEAARERGGRI